MAKEKKRWYLSNEKKKKQKKKNSTIMRSVHGKGVDFSSEVELIRKVILIKILKKRVLKKI